MSKRFLLSAIAVSVIAGVANAGDLNLSITGVNNNDVNFTKEWQLQNKLNNAKSDVNLTPSFGYIPKNIPLGSEKNPVINVTFTNVKDIKTNNMDKTFICEWNGTDLVGQNGGDIPYLTYKTDNGINGYTYVSYAPNGGDVYVSNGKQYVVAYNSNGDLNCSAANTVILPDNASNVTLTLEDGAQNIGLNVALGTGDSQQIHDTASAIVGKQIDQICCGVTTSLSATINSASGFMAFTNNQAGQNGQVCGSTNTPKTDNLTVQCVAYSTDYGINTLNTILDIKGDSANIPFDKDNIVASESNMAGASITPKISVGSNEVNVTYPDDQVLTNPGANNPNIYNVTLAVTGDKQIPVTNFTVDLGLDLDKKNGADMYKLENAPAGQWTYNGTTLQSPYVAVNGNTQTIFRVNNNSNVNAESYWTCTDDNGITVALVPVNAHDANTSVIPANGAAAWLASDILAAAQAQNPDFAANGKMRCNVLVTTPNNNQASGVEIMTINGGRDRVIPFKTNPNN